jgi:hypothetical protein
MRPAGRKQHGEATRGRIVGKPAALPSANFSGAESVFSL